MNPWEEIALEDYENHMALDAIYQLQTLNKIMYEQYTTYDVETIMILGIAGGNGLNHINTQKIKHVYGIDINPKYLEVCKERYPELNQVLITIQADLMQGDIQLPQVDLVIANLFLEYIGYEAFCARIKEISPKYVSVVMQINEGIGVVSASPYMDKLQIVDSVHHDLNEYILSSNMESVGYTLVFEKYVQLPNGKKFARMDYKNLIE